MLTLRKRPQPVAISLFIFVVWLLLCGMADAAPSITLSKKSGPPTSEILVSGRGFEPNVGVDIFFDTKDNALVVTNGKGEFSDAGIHAPRGAHPGEHWVTALERNNDKGAQTPFLVRTNWSQFHFDADGTRLNPYENVLNVNNVGSLGLLWRYRTRNFVACSPVVADGVVYVATENGNFDFGWLSAVNADTGVKLWAYSTGPVDTSPAVANGAVYVGSGNENVWALNARTGALLWSHGTSGDSWSVVADGVVYDANTDGHFYALDASTGAQLWIASSFGTLFSAPAMSNGVAYVVSSDAWALNSSTGSLLWSYSLNPFSYDGGSSPVAANGIVYFGWVNPSGGGGVDALSASTGALLWSYIGSYVASSPAVANGAVYVGSGDNVYALNGATGAMLWSFPTGKGVVSSPAVANGVVYVGSLDNNVYALNAATGAMLWSFPTGNQVESSPVVANGVVYVGSDDGNLYAFSLPRGDQTKEDSAPNRPDLKMLRPDFNLIVSQSVAEASGTEPKAVRDN